MSNKEYPRNWATILSRMSISDIHIEDCQRYAEMQVYLTFLSLTKWELLVVIEMFRDLFEKSSTQLQEATKIENFRGQQRSMAIKALFQENKKLKARIQELESANIRSDNPRHQQALNHSITYVGYNLLFFFSFYKQYIDQQEETRPLLETNS
eukprot:m.266338 g.266338  ORF g.266338 m.266338 type:complete len:153 (+) comp16239_c0_seq30:286-744(+)